MAAETAIGPQRISIDPLDPQRHDRATFSCGTVRLDNFLKRTARKHQAGDFTRVWVATELGNAEILAYYALNAHGLEGDDLPAALTKREGERSMSHATAEPRIPIKVKTCLGRELQRLCKSRGVSRPRGNEPVRTLFRVHTEGISVSVTHRAIFLLRGAPEITSIEPELTNS